MSSDERPFVARNGELITEEIADQLADEAEVGYDIDPSQVRPGPGRKSLAGGSGKSPRVNVRLTQPVYDQLTELAAERGESVSELMREAVDWFVDRGVGKGRR